MSHFRKTWKDYLLWTILVVLGVTTLLPFLWAVTTSLKAESAVYSTANQWIPRNPTTGNIEIHWENYVNVWKRIPLARFYFVSLVVGIATTLGKVATSTLAAYAFARLTFPGRDKLFLIYLATMMVSIEVTIIPSFILISKLGWINSYLALIVPGMFTAMGTFMLRQFFLQVPKELEEAALIDGCSHLGILCRVFLPLSGSAIGTLALFVFLGSWESFMWPLVVTTSLDMMTIPVGLASLKTAYAQELALILAASIQVLLPVFILFILCQKRVTEGIMTTGLGGQ